MFAAKRHHATDAFDGEAVAESFTIQTGDQIIDIVDEVVGVTHGASQPGISAAAVIQGKITGLLDAHAVVEATHPGFFDTGRAA